DVDGQVRQNYINTFRQLDDIRIAVGHLDAQVNVALAQIEVVRAQLKTLIDQEEKDWLCAALTVGAAISAVAGAVVGTVVTGGGPAAAIGAAAMAAPGALMSVTQIGDGACWDDRTNEKAAAGYTGFAQTLTAMDDVSTGLDASSRLISAVATNDAELDDMMRR